VFFKNPEFQKLVQEIQVNCRDYLGINLIRKGKIMSKEEKTATKRIKPELLGGFRDYLPSVMITRQRMVDNIRRTFESFGFLPLETPGLERSSVLGTDKDEFKMQVYRFRAGDQDVTLRFDLTVPLSRVVSANPELIKPFKRYQFGSVWRKESPQAGRYREFAQFDADIVGSDSIIADTEILVLMYETLKNLGIGKFVIRFNNRKILNGLCDYASFDKGKTDQVLRTLDKLDKIGLEGVIGELRSKSHNELGEDGLALTEQTISSIVNFLSLKGNTQELIGRLKDLFKGVPIAEEGIGECEKIVENLESLDIPKGNWKLDLSIARGLGYYTGPVFETSLTDCPEIGSVFSGGRFDDLITRFTGEKIPSVGASVGVDRLLAALDKIGAMEKQASTAKVLITVIDQKLSQKIMRIAQNFRVAGINTEIYLGKEKGLKGQIIYAAKREIPFVVIIGEEEDKAGKLKLKSMAERKEDLLLEKDAVRVILNS